MMVAGVVLFCHELLSVEQLPMVGIVTPSRAREEIARPFPVAFASNHLDGLLSKQVLCHPAVELLFSTILLFSLLRRKWMKKQLRAEYATTHQAPTVHDQEVLKLIDLRLELNEDFDLLTTTPLSSPYENGAAARVVHGVRRILSKWNAFIEQPRKGDLVTLGRTNPGPDALPVFMAKLFSRKIVQVEEGAGAGGGADHEGGGKESAHVVVEYSVEEEEEEIEEDTSRQAQHGASGRGGDANMDEDSSSGSSSGSSSSDESDEDDGEGAGHSTERTGEHGVALGERVDERVKLIEQQATGKTMAVEEQVGGAAAQEGGVGGQQQVGEAAAQEGGAGGQQQEGVAAAQEGGAVVQQHEFRVAAARVGGAGGQEKEGGEAAEEYRRGDERQATVTRRHRTASGSGQAGPSTGGPSTAGQSTAIGAPGDQVVELLQRVEKVEASQKQLVTDMFAKHTEQAAVFNTLAADFRTAWNTISESSKSTLSQCAEAVKGVTAERKLLEGARAKIDEMTGKIIEGVAAAITKASEDAVEKQLKQVEERLVAAVLKGFEKAMAKDMFCSTLPPETMKELKDIVREGYNEAEDGRLEALTEAMARGFQRSAGPSTRSRQEGVGGVRSGAEPRGHERSVPPSSSVGGHVGSPVASPPARGRHPVAKPVEDNEVIVLDQSPLPKTSVAAPIPPPDAFASMRDMLQGLGKTGGKGVVAGEKSGAPNEHVASTGNRALGKRGASTPSGGGAGKGAGEATAGLMSKSKGASAAQSGAAGRAVEHVGNWASSSTPPVAPVAAAPALGNVCLSEPGSPSTSKKKPAATKSSKRSAHATESLDVVETAIVPGQAPVEKTTIVVAARQEKSKKARLMGYTPPPPPDDQGKTRGCKAPFKGQGFGLRKGKLRADRQREEAVLGTLRHGEGPKVLYGHLLARVLPRHTPYRVRSVYGAG
ncbi:unnamed protein product [Closterium sp. Yama58-4]|nr:unnamed protein product [Closterium sp. Yama58-4]